MTKILVTGGAGYIGSHTVKELLGCGYSQVLVLDNLSTGNEGAVLAPARLIKGDLSDKDFLEKTFSENEIDAVIHFAASKDAAESVREPKKYYENNLINSLNLLNAMVEKGVKKIIFSSTAAVYGDTEKVPVDESVPTNPVNPYGWTKLMFEGAMADYERAYGLKYASLRYFNVAGADVDGRLGNDYKGRKEDLVSALMEVAVGKRDKFIINGTDYETKDGSCVRDLIHVNDLASAHILALEYLERGGKSEIFNLGSESGFTVKETADMTKKATGTNFIVEDGHRREGDIVVSIASSKKAKKILGWQQKHNSLESIIKTAWEWENKNGNNARNAKLKINKR